MRGEFAADVIVAAGAVLDDERLTEFCGQPLRDQPRDDVGRASRRGGDDDADGTSRIGFGARCRRASQSTGAGDKAKKLTARNDRGLPLGASETDPAT
jgi:hypothetical protein